MCPHTHHDETVQSSEAEACPQLTNFIGGHVNQLLVPLRYLASLENHCLIEDYYFLQSDLSMIQEDGGI